ncbi:MAG: hypothetical protein MK411_09910 [SAR202 cluster bacterium]|nr:hypothetical protein [SAR202 cluster bacterium]
MGKSTIYNTLTTLSVLTENMD